MGRLRLAGVLVGGCGERSIRFRPALILRPEHAEVMLDRLGGVLAGMEEENRAKKMRD